MNRNQQAEPLIFKKNIKKFQINQWKEYQRKTMKFTQLNQKQK